jgi:hypothetical protein
MTGPRERAEPPRNMIFLVLAVWHNGAHVVGPRNMRLEKELSGDPSRIWEVMFRAEPGNSDRERAVALLEWLKERYVVVCAHVLNCRPDLIVFQTLPSSGVWPHHARRRGVILRL